MKTIALIIALGLAVLLMPLLFKTGNVDKSPPAEMLPWNISLTATGDSRAFGLTLGQSPLSEAVKAFGDAPQLAIIGQRNESGSLEAFFDMVRLGSLTGKVVVTLDADASRLEAMHKRAVKTDYMESATRRTTLHADDRELAQQLPIKAIVFVPSARLEEAIVIDRFGPGPERITTSEGVQHYLYAERGLDIAINGSGKSILQYVSPKQFTLLREPLLKQAAAPATAGASTSASPEKRD